MIRSIKELVVRFCSTLQVSSPSTRYAFSLYSRLCHVYFVRLVYCIHECVADDSHMNIYILCVCVCVCLCLVSQKYSLLDASPVVRLPSHSAVRFAPRNKVCLACVLHVVDDTTN